MELSELVRVHLRDDDAMEAATLAAREGVRESGMRLVRHDQSPDHQLILHDAVTGEHLFTGPFEQGDALFKEMSLADVDTIDSEVTPVETLVDDVPPSLQLAVREWVESNIKEAREFAEGP